MSEVNICGEMKTMANRLWHGGVVNDKGPTLRNEMKIIAMYYNWN